MNHKDKAKFFAATFQEALSEFDTVEEAQRATQMAMELYNLKPDAKKPLPKIPDYSAALSIIDAGLSDLADELLLLLPTAGIGGISLSGQEFIDSVERYRRRLLSGNPWAATTVITADEPGTGSGTAANIEGHAPAHPKSKATRSRAKARMKHARRRLSKHLRLPDWITAVKQSLPDFEILERRRTK
jgi:hypothetical protein